MLPYHAGFSIGFGLSPPVNFFSPRTKQNLWKTLLEGDKLAENAKKWGEKRKIPKKGQKGQKDKFFPLLEGGTRPIVVFFGHFWPYWGGASPPLRKTLPCI